MIGLGRHEEDGGQGPNAKARRRLYLDLKADRFNLGFVHDKANVRPGVAGRRRVSCSPTTGPSGFVVLAPDP